MKAIRVKVAPLFNPEATCPKCGHDQIAAQYLADAHSWACKDSSHKLTEPGCCDFEHMHRTCQRCHFLWIEQPLDALPVAQVPQPPARPFSDAEYDKGYRDGWEARDSV